MEKRKMRKREEFNQGQDLYTHIFTPIKALLTDVKVETSVSVLYRSSL